MIKDDQFAFLMGQVDAIGKACDTLVQLHPKKSDILTLMQNNQAKIDSESSASGTGQFYKNGHKKVVALLQGDLETVASVTAMMIAAFRETQDR